MKTLPGRDIVLESGSSVLCQFPNLESAAAPVRLLIPNITGYLAVCIPTALSIAILTSLNPFVCGLLVMIAGDAAVLYYPAQSASSLVVYERGYLRATEIFWFGCLMTLVAILVALFVVSPYWNLIGEPLVSCAW